MIWTSAVLRARKKRLDEKDRQDLDLDALASMVFLAYLQRSDHCEGRCSRSIVA